VIDELPKYSVMERLLSSDVQVASTYRVTSTSLNIHGIVTPHVHAITSARVISTHSHSLRLIILLATRLSSSFVVFPRSAGSLPSEQRSLKHELSRVIRSGGPLPTIQVQSQTSSGSRPRPPPLPNAPVFKPDIALHNSGTSSGPSYASSIATRVIEFTG